MSAAVTVFAAHKIITMNPSNPEGTHVAVHGPHTQDDTFADHVLTPGFVKADSPILEGFYSQIPYVGYFDRPMPNGSINTALAEEQPRASADSRG